MSSERPDEPQEAPAASTPDAVRDTLRREGEALSEAAGRPSPPQRKGNFFATNNSFFVSWGRAIVLGVRDTAEEMLDEGRKGAREAFDEGWDKFDARTRYRKARNVTPGRRGRKS
ncbi:MAG: hypothetical protein ACRDG3_02535 [Tepidiformaceae bacterium]